MSGYPMEGPVGNGVAEARRQLGPTQRTLANRIDVLLVSLACIEAGLAACPILVARLLREAL